MEKRPPKPFFVILMFFLVSFWGAFWSTLGAFWSTFGKFCCFSLGVSRGPLRDRFWLHFGIILHRFYEHFWCNVGGVFWEKGGFTCMPAHFSKVSIYLFVCFPLADISKIAVLPAWELNFREFAWDFNHFFFITKNNEQMKWSSFSLFLRIGGTGRKAFTIRSGGFDYPKNSCANLKKRLT